MVRIIRHIAANRPNGTVRKPLFDEERPLSPAAVEDTFEDLLAGLTHRPDIASTDIAPREIAANEPAPAKKLPSVEEFHFNEAAARKMANKLAPNQKPRIKSRRPRYRNLNRDRWRSSNESDEQFDERNADGRNLARAIAAPRSSGRGLFWSFCASILIITGTSAAFGFIQPLNDLLPARMADFLSGLSGELNAGLIEGSNASAEFGVASATTASGPRPVSSDRRMASAAVARPVSTTTVRAEVQPPANSGVSGLGEQTALLGATNQKAFELGATVLKLGAIDSAEFATSKSELALEEAPPAVAPAPPPVAAAAAPRVAAPVAAAADQGNKETPPEPALQQPAKADLVQVAKVTPPAITPAPIVTAVPLVLSPLSPAQIERLLERGTELLQSGDIASARLLFLRVAETGDRRGAKGVGMTYDPRIYARLPVTGLTPDREQAEIWYKKAGDVSILTIDGNTAAGTPRALEVGSAEWNAACASKYNSFEPSTGLFTANSGTKRRCKLP